MGDITKPRYVMRRQTMEEELQRTTPPADPNLDRAQALLEDFARFWDAEPQPAERHRLLHSLFAQVWAKDGRIVAVKPHTAFAPYFTAASHATRPHGATESEATIAGATGLEPAASGVTGRRSNQLSYAPAWRDAGGWPSAAQRAAHSMPSLAERSRGHAKLARQPRIG